MLNNQQQEQEEEEEKIIIKNKMMDIENYLFQLDDFIHNIHIIYELNLQLSNQFNEIVDGSYVNGQNIDDIIISSKDKKI
ncbi:unnamed protein product [Didymodactylos carnosus]|uniref:Uncharacterized protein n=1 Tax=Didymodactylos carnosus TaxID=1234261 RepID=A0A814VF52_9BILA|nr:unnamed protein product [Didymodactylos carnosus]CAF3954412.1 unnamed protein product [Didymodactylos carnosus]